MPDETRILGRTGLRVSLIGLGCGGNSRLGLAYGQTEAQAAGVVRAALDLSITLVDTARVYGTERAVGLALQGRRDGVVLSSKSPYLDPNHELLSAQAFAENIETSLRELRVETIDIYFIHGLTLPYYAAARERFLPVLERARRDGKIRFAGITEAFERDTTHAMLQQAVHDPVWDVIMTGYNLVNPSARARVLAYTAPAGTATLGMFAVRRGLVDETLLRALLQRLAQTGQIDPALPDAPDLLAALGLRGTCATLSEAAYRFCVYQPGLDCVLSGTGSAEHLRANLRDARKGPLPEGALRRLEELFGRVDSVSGQVR